MKKNSVWTIISVAIFALQALVETLFAVFILRLNMLPGKYAAILIAVLVLMLLASGLLLFIKNRKGLISNSRKIVAYVLALLVVLGSALGAKLAFDAYKTVSTVTNGAVTTNARTMYVFVRADDPAESLNDASDYGFAVMEQYDEQHTQGAISLIEETVGKSIAVTGYIGAADVADALLGGQTDAAILNGVSVALLIEEEAYADFLAQVKVLKAIPLADVEPTEPATEPAGTEPSEERTITNAPFAFYISGSDTRSSMLDVSRSDVNILAVVNPVTKQVLLINTPRDYFVPNPAGGGKLDKLTHCGLYGTDCSMEALEGLYGLEIDYYGQINFTGFETLVDAIGGVTVYADQSFKAGNIYIQSGENHLNGADALKFARERYHVSGGDRGRGKNQMKVIKAVIEKMTTGTTIIANYTDILKSLEGMFTTSLTMEQISMLVKMQLNDMAKWNVQTYSVSGVGGSEKTYSAPGLYAYVMYMDEEQVAYASQLIQRVLNGETLTSADMTLPE